MPMSVFDEHDALVLAVRAARRSPCAKSQRGAVIWKRLAGIVVPGWNHPPEPMSCSGSLHCREHCNKFCVHAEADAILRAGVDLQGCEMLHVKVVDGEPVPSGGPSCWQCSRLILQSGIKTMWLLHDGLRGYDAHEFHLLTLHECGLLEESK